jgi:flavin reductase
LQGNSVIIETPISPDIFKYGMRQLAGGVCIVATNSDGEWHGLTMTAVCSLTMDPPSLIACVNRDASAYAIISATRRVSANVLSDDHTGLATLFSSPDIKGPARFDAQHWTRRPTESPL